MHGPGGEKTHSPDRTFTLALRHLAAERLNITFIKKEHRNQVSGEVWKSFFPPSISLLEARFPFDIPRAALWHNFKNASLGRGRRRRRRRLFVFLFLVIGNENYLAALLFFVFVFAFFHLVNGNAFCIFIMRSHFAPPILEHVAPAQSEILN